MSRVGADGTSGADSAEAAQAREVPRRVRRPVSEHVALVRELWLLRERARVQAAERQFLAELARLLDPSHRAARFSNVSPSHTTSTTTTTTTTTSARVRTPADEADHVYESFPPPRGESAPAREPPFGHLRADAAVAAELQRVTNLIPRFRALLEGDVSGLDSATAAATAAAVQRSQSWGELLDARAVSNALEGEFRHELEGVLVRRDAARDVGRRTRFYNARGNDSERDAEHMQVVEEESRNESLERAVRLLREEVSVLKNVMNASFDMQIDIQRAIRQEVAAAMHHHGDSRYGANSNIEASSSECTHEADNGQRSNVRDMEVECAQRERPRERELRGGSCTICMEESVDAVLYACGHMCTCARCGRQLIAGGQTCPICRAPVRDVVRVYMVAN